MYSLYFSAAATERERPGNSPADEGVDDHSDKGADFKVADAVGRLITEHSEERRSKDTTQSVN